MSMTEHRVATRPTTATVPAPRRPLHTGLAAAWLVGFPAALLLEPAALAQQPQPWWAHVLAIGVFAGIVAAVSGLLRGRAWAPGMSLVAAGAFAAGVFACPATGHHAFGLWWVGEFAISLGLVAASGVAYLKRA